MKLVTENFCGFGKTHNLASGLAKNDWILSVDADEVLSEELVREILQLKLEKTNIYSISRHNYFNGKRRLLSMIKPYHPLRIPSAPPNALTGNR